MKKVACTFCGSTKNLLVHHWLYLDEETDKHFTTVLCASCHIKLHKPGRFKGKEPLPSCLMAMAVSGIDKVERTVVKGGTSGRIYLPKAWVGKKVIVVLKGEGE